MPRATSPRLDPIAINHPESTRQYLAPPSTPEEARRRRDGGHDNMNVGTAHPLTPAVVILGALGIGGIAAFGVSAIFPSWGQLAATYIGAAAALIACASGFLTFRARRHH